MSTFFSSSSSNEEIINFNNFLNSFTYNTDHDRFMLLKIFIDSSSGGGSASASALKEAYKACVSIHNQKIASDPHFFDAGFDLLLPSNTVFVPGQVNKVDFRIKCAAKIHFLNRDIEANSRSYFTGFYTHPRSSLSKTPLRLANSTGIIDAGYRGNLIGMFDCNNDDYTSELFSRLLQICAPSLMPIFVEVVDNIEELGPSTSRGVGGIGSTGV
jgi:dUTP pyrophosphatase